MEEDISGDLQQAISQMEGVRATSDSDEEISEAVIQEVRGAGMFGSNEVKEYIDEEEYDDLFSMDGVSEKNRTLSAEILVSIATESKRIFRTYHGLVDTDTSASLMDRSIIPKGEARLTKGKGSRWKTQARTFQTQGRVQMKMVRLPHFTTK